MYVTNPTSYTERVYTSFEWQYYLLKMNWNDKTDIEVTTKWNLGETHGSYMTDLDACRCLNDDGLCFSTSSSSRHFQKQILGPSMGRNCRRSLLLFKLRREMCNMRRAKRRVLTRKPTHLQCDRRHVVASIWSRALQTSSWAVGSTKAIRWWGS